MSLAELAEAVGARDVFVLQNLGEGRLVNLDGVGRGAGWAGNLSIDPESEPWLSEVRPGRISRYRRGVPERVFGPYWADEAAALMLGETIVVIGGRGISGQPAAALEALAQVAADAIGEVPVAKRLADELEVSQAALAIASLRPSSLETGCEEIARLAARSLSCEFGAILLLGDSPAVFMSREGWRPAATDDEVIASLLPLATALQAEPMVEQDLSCTPFPYQPLSFSDGLVARATVPIAPAGLAGMLVVAHAAGAPRGFTLLCQKVLMAIARAADVVLGPLTEATPAGR